MVDRAQEHGRLTAPPARDRTGTEEAGLVVVICVALVGIAVVAGVGEGALSWAADLPTAALSALVAALAVAPVALGVLAARRFRQAEASRHELDHLAHHDPLTGLHNRRFLGHGFEEMLRRARRTNGRLGVFFVDLDGFKAINDAHGHDAGDQLMVALADRLRESKAVEDEIVRYGGDEFVLLCPDVGNRTSAERVARRILRAVETPFPHGDGELRISASIGIALTEERCSRPDEVLRDADVAMYQAKHEGPGRYALFDRSLSDSLTPSTAERRLRQALEDGEFRLYYQPIVSLWTKRLVGVEALLRWKDPRRGTVNPDEFLPALEETGLIVPVGRWVLEEVCRQARAWELEHPDRPPLNVKMNLSARQLAQADVVRQVADVLADSGATPDRISLEIPEGALMFDLAGALEALKGLKALGVSIALDDFGTGNASLTILRALDVDLLTIHRSFVDGLLLSREDAVIVEHVIGLAKALSIVTVAEGVETEAQMDRLREMTCDLAQGWWFSHPQPPDVISRLLAADAGSQEWSPPEGDDDDAEDEAPAAPTVDLTRFGSA